MRRRRRRTALIKINNPHLAGGEQIFALPIPQTKTISATPAMTCANRRGVINFWVLCGALQTYALRRVEAEKEPCRASE